MSKFEIYKDNSNAGEQCWRWRLIDSNNIKIARSEEAFVKYNVKRSIKTLQERVNPNTPISLDESKEDKDTGYRFEYFQSNKNQEWYWRLKAGNHELMAIGGEGFSSKQSILDSMDNVRLEIGRAGIVFENPEDDTSHQAKSEDDTKEDPSIPSGS